MEDWEPVLSCYNTTIFGYLSLAARTVNDHLLLVVRTDQAMKLGTFPVNYLLNHTYIELSHEDCIVCL